MYYKNRVKALRPIESKAVIKPIKKAVFDIETYMDTAQPYACAFYDGKNLMQWEDDFCIAYLVDEITRRKYSGYYIYAHNGGRFDFNYIMHELIKRKMIAEPLRINSRIAQITIIKDKYNIVLRDSCCQLPFSLKELTHNFKVDNKKGSFDHTKINPRNWMLLRDEWLPYLISDCKGLYQVLEKVEQFYLEHFHMNLKPLTIATQALEIFKRNYLKEMIPQYKNIEKDIRESYYGGRTEVFKMSGENLNYYDVNSLYPAVMSSEPSPVGLALKDYAFTLNHYGIAKCNIKAPTNLKIPLLPYRAKTGKLLFPLGQWNGFYCTPELLKAKELGYEIDIIYGYEFKQANIFKDYIKEIYQIKQESEKDSVPYIVAKLLLNSLSGKFGQRREKETYYLNPSDPLGMTPLDPLNNYGLWSKTIESDSSHILPAISSMVTCNARLKLYNYIEQVLGQYGEIYYCDTDSLITNVKLPTSNKMGDMKLEHEVKKGIFLSPKFYAIQTATDKIVHTKGFPRKLFTYEDLEIAQKTNNYTGLKHSEPKKFALLFESLKRNKKCVSLLNKKRSVKTTYDKRRIIGIETEPLIINEITI